MKNCLVLFVCIIPFFGSTQIAMLKTDYMHQPVSARATGLGVSYLAVADDASAIYWNPGALGMMRHISIAGGVKFGGDIASLEESSNSTSITTEVDATNSPKFGLNHVSIAVPIPFNDYSDFYVVPAFSYHAASNNRSFHSNWDINYDGSAGRQIIDYNVKGGRNEMSMGLAVGLGEHFGVGFAYNVLMGNLSSVKSYENIMGGATVQKYDVRNDYSYKGNSFTIGFKASTCEASDNVVEADVGYGSGVDFGVSMTLPSQRTNFRVVSGQNIPTYIQQPLRISAGLAGRLDEALLTFGVNYTDYSKSYLSSATAPVINFANELNISADSLFFNSLTALSFGLEVNQTTRISINLRNYQYRVASLDGGPPKQPWTFGLAGGWSIPLADYILLDITGQIEFFNLQDTLTGYNDIKFNYKGATLNLFSTLRITLPYSEF